MKMGIDIIYFLMCKKTLHISYGTFPSRNDILTRKKYLKFTKNIISILSKQTVQVIL